MVPAMSKFTQGQVRQFLETVVFIGTGSMLTMYACEAEHLSAAVSEVSANAIAFLAGKTAYFAVRAICALATNNVSLGRHLGTAAGIATAAGALWIATKMNNKLVTPVHSSLNEPPQAKALTITRALGVSLAAATLGSCLRELSFKGIKVLASLTTSF